MANKKEIIRDKVIYIKVSQAEKDLWDTYAKELGINSSRLARNTLLTEAESIINKYITKPVIKAYIKYAKITNNTEILERIKTD